MRFLVHIEKNGYQIDIYEKMKKSELPLFIYGGGNLAKNIKKKLDEYEIKLDGCITDSGQEVFLEYDVYKYDNFKKIMKKESCNLLIGFASAYAYEKKCKLEKEPIFKEIFEIANPFDHHTHFEYDFVRKHCIELEEVYNELEDEYSRECFCAFINARIWENSDYVRAVFRNEIDEFNNDVISLDINEVFLDVGAYNGGSINRFLKSNNRSYKKIIGIEPEDENFRKLQLFCEENRICAELHHIGCWNKKDRLSFNNNDDKCCRLDENSSNYIDVDAIDNIISKDIPVSLINLGISTAEKEILEGAKQTISKSLPKMLIFMGSAKEELYTIPKYIKEINESYKLYYRFIQAMPSRIFLFAIPDDKRRI